MKDLSGSGLTESAHRMHYILRIASAMCFIGHGVFGIITKPIWCNYFAVFGIGHDLAYTLMPVVGTVDITMGLILLFYPIRVIPAWLVVWGIVTASMRPLSGEPFAEMIERAGNFGAPLALLMLGGTAMWGAGSAAGSGSGVAGARGGEVMSKIRYWFSRLDPNPQPDARTISRVALCLRIVVFLLLVGHGWLNLTEKKGLIQQYTNLGFSNPANTALFAGMFEILAGLAILIRPVRPLLVALFIWKMGTELFYPKYEIVEWVERGGSYGALLALYFVLGKSSVRDTSNQHKLAL
ncbi:MAG TPA: DoxX family membrane protein [Puia sp.]|nr:DoxX family membrane protein [Puia sp.]